MNFLLEFSKEQFSQKNIPLLEVFVSGGMVFLTGILTVFAVLGILWVALLAFKFFFHDLARGEKKVKVKKEKVGPTPVYSPSAASDDNEIIAVIAAAIAMAESECGENKKFRVVSFRRK